MLSQLAKAEKINASYLCRVLRLTLLAPDLVEAILDGRQPVALPRLLKVWPAEWAEQRRTLVELPHVNHEVTPPALL